MADFHAAYVDPSQQPDDPDRLMHGEDAASRSPAEIAHWVGAYTELLGFKDRLLVDIDKEMQSLSKPASAEIQELDVGLVLTQRRRYRRRLAFWLERQTEVNSPSRSRP